MTTPVVLGRDPDELRALIDEATPAEAEVIAAALEHELLADDIPTWTRVRLGEHLWSKQVEIAEAFRAHRKVAVKACHGPGKSYLAGRIVAHWIDTHPPGEAMAVTSAPTDPQVKAILWREITKAHRKGNLPGRVTLDAQWKVDDELVAIGRKPADHDDHGFQGIHARYLLVVMDEACGIPRSLWTGASTLGTNADARMLAIGNPDDPTSEFAAMCEGAPEDGTSGMSSQGWWVITISIYDTPNFTGEDVPDELRHFLPSAEWLEDHRRRVGEGSPLWVSKALGQFPKDASTGVVPWSWLKACTTAETRAKLGALQVPVVLGVDVAGSDQGDETVVYERRGPHVGRRWSVQSADPEVVLGLVEDAVRLSGATRVKYDAIGVGWGLGAGLRRTFPDVDFVPVVVSEAAPGEDSARFVNLRSWIWWKVGRELSQDRAWNLAGPEGGDGVDDQTLAELSAPRYREVNGRVQVESKDDIRKRLGRSTDNADALLLAYYEPEAESTEATGVPHGGRTAATRRGR